MDRDVARFLAEFAREADQVSAEAGVRTLVQRTRSALVEALICAGGSADAPQWYRLHAEARRLVAWLDARRSLAFPGLRAFVAENADLFREASAGLPA